MAEIRVKNSKSGLLIVNAPQRTITFKRGDAKDVPVCEEVVKYVASGALEVVDTYGNDIEGVQVTVAAAVADALSDDADEAEPEAPAEVTPPAVPAPQAPPKKTDRPKVPTMDIPKIDNALKIEE